MISLSNLNKLILFTFFINILIFNFTISFAAVDIWEKKKKKNDQSNQINNEKEIKIESPILSEDINKIVLIINPLFVPYELLSYLDLNLSCIIIKLYLHSKIKA